MCACVCLRARYACLCVCLRVFCASVSVCACVPSLSVCRLLSLCAFVTICLPVCVRCLFACMCTSNTAVMGACKFVVLCVCVFAWGWLGLARVRACAVQAPRSVRLECRSKNMLCPVLAS